MALRILFEAEVGKFNIEKVLERYISACSIKSISDFVQELINTVAGNKKEIDGIIQQHAIGWKLERMGSVDRNILRFAIAEMVYLESIPISASINEAIELGKCMVMNNQHGFLTAFWALSARCWKTKIPAVDEGGFDAFFSYLYSN